MKYDTKPIADTMENAIDRLKRIDKPVRENKFRAWYENSQTWVYFTIGQLFSKVSEAIYAKMCINGVIWYQFTGLKDCKRTKEFPNGQEIYRGDKYKYKKERGIIEFKDGNFICISPNCKIDYLLSSMVFDIEIISNIHQPEKS